MYNITSHDESVLIESISYTCSGMLPAGILRLNLSALMHFVFLLIVLSGKESSRQQECVAVSSRNHGLPTDLHSSCICDPKDVDMHSKYHVLLCSGGSKDSRFYYIISTHNSISKYYVYSS